MANQPTGVTTGAIVIQIDYEQGLYSLLAPTGDEGAEVEFGEPATLTVDGVTYLAYRDKEGEVDGEIGEAVQLLAPVKTEEVEVEFEDVEGDEGDEDDEDGGEGEVVPAA
jgi:hypothetical protein